MTKYQMKKIMKKNSINFVLLAAIALSMGGLAGCPKKKGEEDTKTTDIKTTDTKTTVAVAMPEADNKKDEKNKSMSVSENVLPQENPESNPQDMAFSGTDISLDMDEDGQLAPMSVKKDPFYTTNADVI